ncbi:MAG: T9SS type A sorting domain-containing protein [Saprospiraceae bacterium]|nr:T9SS type A sorting domain-containing protein [Saprospiraceae bacterium]MBK8298745.1 T9SS type A sorting domain-containing protein [Saprospiraceae bacterium]
MKYIYLIICILCTNGLFAQNQRFIVTPNPNSISFIPDMTSHKAHGTVKNNTNGTIKVSWIREIIQLPVDWNTYICDANLCYSPLVGKCPDNYPNVIKANDSTLLDVYVTDDGTDGAAHIVMWVYEKEDTSKKLKVDYLFNKIVSNNEVKNIEIKVYPNPTYNEFFVDYNQGLTRIDLYSILGKKVTSFEAMQRKSYNTSHLMDGLYFIKLIGPNEQVLQTIRLQKGSLRP